MISCTPRPSRVYLRRQDSPRGWLGKLFGCSVDVFLLAVHLQRSMYYHVLLVAFRIARCLLLDLFQPTNLLDDFELVMTLLVHSLQLDRNSGR
jgi:hypothetical protein